MSASPGAVGLGTPVPAARIDRTSAARNRPKATARSRAATTAAGPWAAWSPARSSRSPPASAVMPDAAAALMNSSAAVPSAQNAFSAGVLGRAARCGCGPGPAVMLERSSLTAAGSAVRLRDRAAAQSPVTSYPERNAMRADLAERRRRSRRCSCLEVVCPRRRVLPAVPSAPERLERPLPTGRVDQDRRPTPLPQPVTEDFIQTKPGLAAFLAGGLIFSRGR